MQTITIETKEREKTISLVKDALDLERRVLEQSLTKTQENVNKLLSDLKIDLKTFLEGKVEHTEENDMVLLELEGELAFTHRL